MESSVVGFGTGRGTTGWPVAYYSHPTAPCFDITAAYWRGVATGTDETPGQACLVFMLGWDQRVMASGLEDNLNCHRSNYFPSFNFDFAAVIEI